MGEGTLRLKPEEVPAWRKGENGGAGREESSKAKAKRAK
jgi:hypothetical protein